MERRAGQGEEDVEELIPALSLRGQTRVVRSLDTDTARFFPVTLRPYPHQIMFLDQARKFFAASDERILLNYIPTAGGKSPLAVAITQAWIAGGGRAVILCPNKELQNQYKKDFGDGQISVITGASEFKCKTFPDAGCGSLKARRGCSLRRIRVEDGEPTQSSCECPYRERQLRSREDASRVPLCFTPHSFLAYRDNQWLSPHLPAGDGLLVVDEAHLLPDTLADNLTLSIRLDLIVEALSAPELAPLAGGSFGDAGFALGGYAGVAGENLSSPVVADHRPSGFVKSKDMTSLVAATVEVAGSEDPATLVSYTSLIAEIFGRTHRQNNEGQPLAALEKSHEEFLSRVADRLGARADALLERIKLGAFDELTSHFPWLKGASEDAWNRYADHMKGQERKLRLVADLAFDTQWAVEVTKGGAPGADDGVPGERWRSPLRLLVRPSVIPLPYLRKFFAGFSKVVLMSGTLFKNHLERLGLVSPKMLTDEGRIIGVRRFEGESRIEPHRRRMIIDHVHGASVNFRNIPECFEKFARFIVEKVADKLPGEKGVIHVSSALQAEKMAELGNRIAMAKVNRGLRKEPMAVFITAKRDGWAETFRRFKEIVPDSNKPTVFLVAARRYEGLDLKDDLARINIIAKTPYPNTKDTMVLSLDALFQTYSVVSTLTSFIQAANRAVRHPADWALNICLDTSASKLFERYGEGLPQFVTEAMMEARDPDWFSRWEPPERPRSTKKRVP